MRTIAERVSDRVRRIPDGETGERAGWIYYQYQKFQQMPEIEEVGMHTAVEGGYAFPTIRLADGADPDAVAWPNLGYADAYRASFDTFQRLKDDGIIPPTVRFQIQYPTPLAAINAYVERDDQDRLEASYEPALFADLTDLVASLPHEQIAVQWDVAVEFGNLEDMYDRTGSHTFDAITARLARCADQVPADIPVGFHLCYGDYEHRHVTEPQSLQLQVDVINRLHSSTSRDITWFSFTVPQYQHDPDYFSPLRDLNPGAASELYFGLVPYHPDEQTAGVTDQQVSLIDNHLPTTAAREQDWGICTECGMGRADHDDMPRLIDLHHEIVATYQ